MKSLEFMYWLQGHFEMCESEKITDKQMNKIKNHLKMVEITDGKQLWPFCSWLQGFLMALEDKSPTISQTKIIKNRLYEIFDHAVDRNINQRENNTRKPNMHLNSSDSSVLIKC